MVRLFKPPVQFEATKPYAYGGAQRGLASGQLGDAGDVLQQIHNNFIDLVGTLTGAKAQAQAEANTLELAKTQAAQSEFLSQQRLATLKAALPWVALVLGVGVVAYAVKKG